MQRAKGTRETDRLTAPTQHVHWLQLARAPIDPHTHPPTPTRVERESRAGRPRVLLHSNFPLLTPFTLKLPLESSALEGKRLCFILVFNARNFPPTKGFTGMDGGQREDISRAVEKPFQQESGRSPRVVVIGAGFAGVAAAGTLVAGGIRDVILLEAQHRPGGRVHTVFLEDGHLEMGAQFLHGEEGNPLFALAEKEGLLLDGEEDEEKGPDTIIQFRHDLFYTPDGHVVPKHTITDILSRLEDLTMEANKVHDRGEASDVTVSIGDYFRQSYPTLFDGIQVDEDLKSAVFRWFEAWHILDSGGTVDQLSLPGHGRYRYNPGSGVQETKTGMAALLHILLRDTVPSECLRLDKPVRAVHWNAAVQTELHADEKIIPLNGTGPPALNNNVVMMDLQGLLDANILQLGPVHSGGFLCNESDALRTSGLDSASEKDAVAKRNKQNAFPVGSVHKQPGFNVLVECEDGEVFEADHVIVTASIGFLKEHASFFQPGLPDKHREAVQAMGFGTIAKVFLIWDRGEASNSSIGLQSCVPCICDAADEWWRQVLGEDVYNIQLLWPESFEPQLKSAKSPRRTSAGKPWYVDVSSFGLIHSHETCLLTWVCGEAAEIMESLPESEVTDVLHELLVLYLKKPDMPQPTRIVRTTWHTNPFTRGSYSYLATGSSLTLHDLLRQPLPSPKIPTLQLAGEACSKHYFSTAHGALESGHVAARTLLRHYNMAAC